MSDVKSEMGPFMTGLFFTANVIMGSGILAVPHSFFVGGWVLGILVFVLIGVLSVITISWNYEGQLRAHILADLFHKMKIRLASHDADATENMPSMQTINVHHDAPGGRSPSSPAGGGYSSFESPQQSATTGGGGLASVNGFRGDEDDAKADLTGGSDALPPSKASEALLIDRREGDDSDGHGHEQRVAPLKSFCMAVKHHYASRAHRRARAQPKYPFLLYLRNTADTFSGGGGGGFGYEDDTGSGVAGGESYGEAVDPETDYSTLHQSDYLEINDILLIFGGPYAVYGWNFCNVAFQISVLWVFLTVLASTSVLGIPLAGMTERLQCNTNEDAFTSTGHCLPAIRIYVLIYSALMMVAIAQDYKFMPALQKGLGGLGYLAVTTMCVTCLVGMGKHDYPGATDQQKFDGSYIQPVKAVNFTNFSQLFSVAVFSFLCHSATSFILRHMPCQRDTKKIFIVAFIFIICLYLSMGIIVNFYIGNESSRVANLNWSLYNEWGVQSWLGELVGSFVLFFPIPSVSAGFILRSRSLSDAIETMVPHRWKVVFCKAVLKRTYKESGYGQVYAFQILLRAVVIVVSACLALATYKFEQAVSVAGAIGFFILFFFPLVTIVCSEKALKALGYNHRTPFHHPSNDAWAWYSIGLIGIISFMYYIVTEYFGVR